MPKLQVERSPASVWQGAAQGSSRLRFVLATLAWLGLLLWPWPGWGSMFAAFYGHLGEAICAAFAPPGVTVRWQPEAAPDAWNALVTLTRSGDSAQLLWDVRRAPYLPMAVHTALSLAFPVRWHKRLGIGLLGLALLQVLPTLRLIALFSSDTPFKLFELPKVLMAMNEIAARVLVLPPGMAFAVPALLFLALSFGLWPVEAGGVLAGDAPLIESGEGDETVDAPLDRLARARARQVRRLARERPRRSARDNKRK